MTLGVGYCSFMEIINGATSLGGPFYTHLHASERLLEFVDMVNHFGGVIWHNHSLFYYCFDLSHELVM